MKRNGMFLARYLALILTVSILMIQVAVAENNNQFGATQELFNMRLILTVIVAVVGGAVLYIGFNNKNQKK